MSRRSVTITIISIIALTSYGVHRFRNKALPVETTLVERKNITQVITASGELDSRTKAELKFETTGKLVWLPTRVGDQVLEGQALASLDSRSTEEGLRQAEANLRKAQADLDKAGEIRREFQIAHKYDSPSSELFSQFGQYDAQVRAAEALVASYHSQLAQARTATKKITLTSPISGTITELNIAIGELFQATGKPALVIADLSPQSLYFKIEIDETDLGKVAIGQQANISLDTAEDQVFKGSLTELAPQVSLNNAGDSIIKAKISLDQDLPEHLRFLGLSGDAEIILNQREQVLALPLEAVLEEDGETYIWKVEHEKAKKVKVVLGMEDEFEAEIVSGLYDGAPIITRDFGLLKEGQRVVMRE